VNEFPPPPPFRSTTSCQELAVLARNAWVPTSSIPTVSRSDGWLKALARRHARVMISVWGKFYPGTANFDAMQKAGFSTSQSG